MKRIKSGSMSIDTVKYQRRIVAFIDILGFKDIVKQSEADPTKIELLHSVLDYLKDWEKPDKWEWKLVESERAPQHQGIEKFDIRGKTNSTSFSDSIVVSVKVDDNVNQMTSTLIANLAYIGAILIEKGILLRGAITIGNIIHNDNGTVFGQGLIDAYLLESKSAKYPRIILSDKLIKELNYPLETKRNQYPYHQYICRFDDGCAGFHQMSYYEVIDDLTEVTKRKLMSNLESIRNIIIAGLDSSFESVDIFEKYRWLKEQYNDLTIISDIDPQTQTEEHVKIQIKEFEGSGNIHYKYFDKLDEIRRQRKMFNV